MSLPTMTSIDGLPVARMPVDIDAANAAQVEEILAGAVSPEPPCLILDLRETRYLDSAGIDMLFKLDERLRRRRQSLQLVVAETSPLRRLLQITGIDRTLPVHAELEDAGARGRARL